MVSRLPWVGDPAGHGGRVAQPATTPTVVEHVAPQLEPVRCPCPVLPWRDRGMAFIPPRSEREGRVPIAQLSDAALVWSATCSRATTTRPTSHLSRRTSPRGAAARGATRSWWAGVVRTRCGWAACCVRCVAPRLCRCSDSTVRAGLEAQEFGASDGKRVDPGGTRLRQVWRRASLLVSQAASGGCDDASCGRSHGSRMSTSPCQSPRSRTEPPRVS